MAVVIEKKTGKNREVYVKTVVMKDNAPSKGCGGEATKSHGYNLIKIPN